jgi:hypothetical protein
MIPLRDKLRLIRHEKNRASLVVFYEKSNKKDEIDCTLRPKSNQDNKNCENPHKKVFLVLSNDFFVFYTTDF